NDSRWNVSLQESNGDSSGSLSGEYLAQPLSLRLDHFTSIRNGLQTHTTGVGLNTGFAWVGLQGAFTQPINDSFVLIHTKEFPSGQELIINPNGENGEAQLGPRTATVLRDQSAYYRYFVNVDSTSLPVGYLLEKEFYGVQPTYRSGIAIDLGLKKKVMVKGRLVNRSLQPLSFVAGDVINSQGQLVDNNFFTNKSGGFLIEGLEPGIYKVITDHPGSVPISFEVRNVDGNMLSLGDLIQQEEAGE
ncbi:MAG: hypothetical protein KUL82_00470, partial [Bdellovibrio sp.]|nr:hypothetical protein [Bdellovibrio sp.]